MPKYYTPLQSAALLGLSKNTMYKYIKDGTIRSVRLGGGRIRVPASEINKLMIVSEEIAVESQDNLESSVGAAVVNSLDIPQEDLIENEDISELEVADLSSSVIDPDDQDVEYPAAESVTVYDWFVGVGAAMVSLSFFLFDYTSFADTHSSTGIVFWLLKTALFLWGWAHIVLSLLSSKHSTWKRLSYLCGGLIFGLVAGLFYLSGSLRGISLYISLSLGLVVSASVYLAPAKRYLTHILFAIGSMLFVNFILPGDNLKTWGEMAADPQQAQVTVIAITTLFCIAAAMMLLFQSRVRTLYLAANYLLVILAIYIAYVSVLYGMWDRVALLIVWAVFGSLFPYADRLDWGGGEKKWVVAESMAVVGVMVLVVSIVGSLMSNMRKTYVDGIAESSVEEVRIDVDREIERAQSRLKAVAASKLLREAVRDADSTIQKEHLRDMVKGSLLYTQMFVFDTSGNVLSYYPETLPSLTGNSFAFHDYFDKALHGESYVSPTLFRASLDGAPWIAAVSVPLVDDQGQVIGVLAGRLNLDLFADIVDGFAAHGQGILYLLDQSGRVISATTGTAGDSAISVGEIAQNLHPTTSASPVTISEITTNANPLVKPGLITNAKTNCCDWQVVYERPTVGAVNMFEIVGFALVLGIMVLLAVAIAVVSRMRHHVVPTQQGVRAI